MESNLINVMGTHSYFYYCGTAHLLVNIFAYIAAGIKNNEKIFISMEEHPYCLLIDCFKKQGIENFLNFKSVKELIQNHKKNGFTGLKNELDLNISKSIKEGFYGIRWIGQPTHAIQETSKQDFLNYEKDLSGAIKNTKSSIICIYDFYDFINAKEYIDDEILNSSKDTHAHKLYKFKLVNN